MEKTVYVDGIPEGLVIVVDDMVLIGSGKKGKGEEV